MTVFLTDSFTWQLGDNGFTLNTNAAQGAFVDIDRATGFASAPFRETKKDHEGVDGGFLDAEFETGRDILLTGTCYMNGTDYDAILDRLQAEWAPSKTLVPLYFTTSGLTTRVLFVKPRGVTYDIDALARVGACAISFSAYAELPHKFDTVLQSSIQTVGATIFTGFSLPLGFPFGFGGTSSTTDGANIYNGGNRPAPVTLILQGPCSGPVIYNDTVGTYLSFSTLTLGATDVMVVDTYYKTVRINGGNRRSFLDNAGWFSLVPGANFIRFRAFTGTGTLTVQWRSAWR